MDKELMQKRILGFEAACDAADKKMQDDHWIVDSSYVTIPTRRLPEMLELARIGLDHTE